MKSHSRFALMFGLLFASTHYACGCEPVPVLAMIWAGPASFGLLLPKMALGLLIVVAIKAVIFARQAGLGMKRGLVIMIGANIISTIPGLIIAFLIGGVPQPE